MTAAGREVQEMLWGFRLVEVLAESGQEGVSLGGIAEKLDTSLWKANGFLRMALQEHVAEAVPDRANRYRVGVKLSRMLVDIGAKIRAGNS